MTDKNIFDDAMDSAIDEAAENRPGGASEQMIDYMTPWRRATNMIFIGMALSVITLNFLMLQYILPLIGMVMAMLGFRALRAENVYFKACFVLSAADLCVNVPILAVNATVYASEFNASDALKLLTLAFAALKLLILLLMRKGFAAVQQKAGRERSTGAVSALIVWYAALIALGLFNASGWIILGFMIAVYVIIIRGLFVMARGMEEAGCAVRAAEVRISDKYLTLTIAAALCAGIACGYIFFDGYSMEWTVVEVVDEQDAGAPGARQDSEIYSVRKQLLDLGFPENALDDMTYDDIMACADPLRVVVWEDNYSMNEWTEGAYGGSAEDDGDDITLTDIGVQLSDGRWKLIDRFEWNDRPGAGLNGGFRGTEAVRLRPVCNMSDRWVPEAQDDDQDGTTVKASGRVLSDREGRTYAAPYHYLGVRPVQQADAFLGTEVSNDIFAEFSLPRSGERQRGYIMYGVRDRAADEYELDGSGGGYSKDAQGEYAGAEDLDDAFGGSGLYSLVSYAHQVYWLRYPAITAADALTNGWSTGGNAFRTVQSGFKFYEGADLSDNDYALNSGRRYSNVAARYLEEREAGPQAAEQAG